MSERGMRAINTSYEKAVVKGNPFLESQVHPTEGGGSRVEFLNAREGGSFPNGLDWFESRLRLSRSVRLTTARTRMDEDREGT